MDKISGIKKINFDKEFETLIISFCSSWSIDDVIQPFQWTYTLGKLNAKVLCVRDLDQSYYLSNLYDESGEIVATDVIESKKYFSEIIRESRCKNIITMGSSCGGHASIMYGNLLNVNYVLAMNPQTFILPVKFVKRPGRILNLSNENEQLLQNVKLYGKENDAMNFGNFCELDFVDFTGNIKILRGRSTRDKKYRMHIDRCNNNKFEILQYPHRAHGPKYVKWLRDSGELTRILKECM